jgi:hypothetical protein
MVVSWSAGSDVAEVSSFRLSPLYTYNTRVGGAGSCLQVSCV